MKKIIYISLFFCIFIFLFNNLNIGDIEQLVLENEEEDDNLEYITDEIELIDIDGSNYEFTYNNLVFKVLYSTDNWKIYDSYLITNRSDMKKICDALIEIHPIHGRDMISYRTSDDMVYEWVQHNLAYKFLPNDNSWKNSAKDVDFDPEDQGKSIKEIYEDRIS